MKIVCSRQQLVEAVSNVQRAVSTKSSVPALEGILLRTSGGEVTLCGYDLELGMTTSIESSVEESGSVVLSARLFGSVTTKEISEGLKQQYNIDINKSKLVLADPIKAFGGYEVKCKLGYEITGTVRVMVTEEA